MEISAKSLLVDVPGTRVRLSTPELLHSTFSRLMYLDGRYDKLFDKVHEETGFAGEGDAVENQLAAPRGLR